MRGHHHRLHLLLELPWVLPGRLCLCLSPLLTLTLLLGGAGHGGHEGGLPGDLPLELHDPGIHRHGGYGHHRRLLLGRLGRRRRRRPMVTIIIVVTVVVAGSSGCHLDPPARLDLPQELLLLPPQAGTDRARLGIIVGPLAVAALTASGVRRRLGLRRRPNACAAFARARADSTPAASVSTGLREAAGSRRQLGHQLRVRRRHIYLLFWYVCDAMDGGDVYAGCLCWAFFCIIVETDDEKMGLTPARASCPLLLLVLYQRYEMMTSIGVSGPPR